MIRFFFRKKYPNTFSIENLFQSLIEQLKKEAHDPNLFETYELEEYNNSFGSILRNIFNARRKQGIVNHITGDVYSIVLGFNTPTILTIHDCNPLLRYSKWHYRYWAYRILQFELPMLAATYVTVISEKTKSELLKLTNCPARKIRVIPNFVDPDFVPGNNRPNFKCPKILHIGTNENKNLSRLIEAIKGRNCVLRIIGKPSLKLIEQLKSNKVKYSFAYNLSKEEIINEYQSSDLLSFVSTYEGFGLPIIEANACQVPVLTSNLSPMREVASNAACLVDPYEVRSIEAGLDKIFSNEKYYYQLINNGIENAKRFDLGTITSKYLNLYQSILVKKL